jgi:hypothetical protein
MFWMVKGHQKNLNSHPDSKKMIKDKKVKKVNENLILVKNLTKMLGQIILAFLIIYVLCGVTIYAAFWIIGNYGL